MSFFVRYRAVIISLLFFGMGFLLGMFSKRLDVLTVDETPALLNAIDARNLFSRVTIWALIALCISLFSRVPVRSAINVFAFFVGMLFSYCLFSYLWGGFMLDMSYLMVWVVITLLSPVFAYIAWFARRRGLLSVIISAVMIAFFFLQAFSFGADFSYFDAANGTAEILMLAAAVSVLYTDIVSCFLSVGGGIVLAYFVNLSGLSIPYIH